MDDTHVIFVDSEKQQEQRPNIHNEHSEVPLQLEAMSTSANDAERPLDVGATETAQVDVNHTPLHLAVLRRDRAKFQALLHSTPDVNTRARDGMTPLISAVDIGMADMAANLMSAGADVDATDLSGRTALHWATLNNFFNLVILLLQKEPSLNIQDNDGCTPLHYAKAKIARCLLNAGADATVQDNDGRTPLHLAVERGDMTVFGLLLQHTSNLNTRTSDYMTPLQTACYNEMENVVVDLIDAGADINVADLNGKTVLHWATLSNYFSLVNKLLESGANLNIRDRSGCAPLHYAKANIARCLLKAGADTTVQDNDGRTPLHLAVQKGDMTIFGILLRRTTNLNTRMCDGMTPLITATCNEMENMVVELINAGADIHATDRTGMTALHKATFFNYPNLVNILLQNGANLNIRDREGFTPLHYAKADVVRILLYAGADTAVQSNDGQTPLHLAVITKNMPVFQVLLRKTRNLNTCTRHGITPLMDAAQMGLENMAIQMIRAGADVNVVDRKGMTALHWAAKHNHISLVNELLLNEVNLNVQDSSCDTALHYAKTADIAKCLIDAGAEANVQNYTGFTPLHLAVMSCNTSLFNILLPHTYHLNTRCAENNMTPLAVAVKNANDNMVYDLINAGADVGIDIGNNGLTALHWAANFADLPDCEDAASRRANAARMLIEAGADVNARDFSGVTPLHVAMKTKAWPILEILLEHKAANSDAPNASGKSLLMRMLESDSESNVEAFEDLIKEGAPIDAMDSEGRTALHYAAMFDKYDELNLLLKYGAEVNATCQNNMSALHLAGIFHIFGKVPPQKAIMNAWEGRGQTALNYDNARIVKRLLEAGADPEAQNSDGETPLYSAVLKMDLNAFQILKEHTTNLDIPTRDGMTPLIGAVDVGMEYMVFDLIRAGADVNAANCDGSTALHFAARFSNISMNSDYIFTRTNAARMLLEADADPNLQDNSGDTALHVAVKTYAWSVFQELLFNCRTDLNAHNILDDGKTPLMMILERPIDTEIFEDLIRAGASIHERDSTGKTAVHYATMYDKCEELEMLLNAYGADVNAADENGNTALLLAAELSLPYAFDILANDYNVNINVQRDSDDKSLLMIMIESDMRMEDFEHIATRVHNIHVRDKKRRTALHYAAKLDRTAKLIKLAELGANVNAQDYKGQTPLFLAAREGNLDSCSILMNSFKAKREIADNNGKLPVDAAKEIEYKQIVDLLNASMPAG